ncbi:MAG TPA: SH3 domain-containing protein [Puia sp.]|nr:SH3 domain-containing protein [Puia sp.]
MPTSEFRIYQPDAFRDYLNSTRFSREIRFIQNHHTWSPDYSDMNQTPNELFWLDSMRDYHMKVLGWNDIGQNLTTFPNGKIGLCRPIDVTPAGILGANKNGICIENLGNFDTGKDQMTQLQKNTIIYLNAVLCIKFNLSPKDPQIVYHHWFDQKGDRFPVDQVNNGQVGNLQKTCPGTGFFGTNTITSAEANFFPLIKSKIDELSAAPTPPGLVKLVNAVDGLFVRSGPGTDYPASGKLATNTKVTVYTTAGNWSKISNTDEKWVSSYYLI